MGDGQVVDADLSGYFDGIPHAELTQCVSRRVSDGAMLLVRMWLEAPVEEEDGQGMKQRMTRNKETGRGTPHGAPTSVFLRVLCDLERSGR